MGKAILVSCPVHQRRAFATFAKQWQDIEFVNCPAGEKLSTRDRAARNLRRKGRHITLPVSLDIIGIISYAVTDMDLLITGGAGFIGTNATEYFLKKGDRVTIFDNFSRRGSRDNSAWLKKIFNGRLKIVEGDIRDPKSVSKAVRRSDAVIHLAGQVAVTTSVKNPREDFETNAVGTLNVLEAIRLSKNKPLLINASTNKVYGNMNGISVEELPTRYYYRKHRNGITEKFPVDFHSPYGCSKGAAEQYLIDYSRIYGLDTVSFRQSCIYGPKQFGIEDQGWVAWFLISGILNKPITIYGDGKQVRDVLYVDDLVRAYDLAIKNIKKIKGNIFNVGGGKRNSMSVWHEFYPHLEENLKRKIKFSFGQWRPGDQKVYVSNNAKAKKLLMWEPSVDIKDGIKELAGWVKDNKSIIAAALA